MPLQSSHRRAERHLKWQLATVALGTFRQSHEMADRSFEMGGCLRVGRAIEGTLATLVPIINGGVVQASLGEVMGKEFGLQHCEVREAFLEDIAYSGVQIPPAGAQKGIVCSVLHERMFEDIAGVRRRPAAKDKTSLGELVECADQLWVCAVRDRGEQFIGTRDRSRHQSAHLLHRGQSVEAGHQRSLEAGRDRQRQKRLLEYELLLLLAKHPALD